MLDETSGDVLCSLLGAREIRRVMSEMAAGHLHENRDESVGDSVRRSLHDLAGVNERPHWVALISLHERPSGHRSSSSHFYSKAENVTEICHRNLS